MERGRRRHTPCSARVTEGHTSASFKGFGEIKTPRKMLSAPGENDEANACDQVSGGSFVFVFFTLCAPEVDVVSACGLAGLQQKICQNCQFALVDQLKGSWPLQPVEPLVHRCYYERLATSCRFNNDSF